jgi:hypothetical protein
MKVHPGRKALAWTRQSQELNQEVGGPFLKLVGGFQPVFLDSITILLTGDTDAICQHRCPAGDCSSSRQRSRWLEHPLPSMAGSSSPSVDLRLVGLGLSVGLDSTTLPK